MAKSKPDSEFWAAYRDPRWQKRRLEIMQHAGFKCEECGTGEVTLNVHHRHYVKDRKPWEYTDDELQCLCETCHEEKTEHLQKMKQLLGLLRTSDLPKVTGYLLGVLAHDPYTDMGPDDDLRYLCKPSSFEEAEGMADAFTYQPNAVVYGLIKLLNGDQDVSVDDARFLCRRSDAPPAPN